MPIRTRPVPAADIMIQQARQRRRVLLCLLVFAMACAPLRAAETGGALSFDAADAQLNEVSDLLQAAQAGVRASQDQADALKSLWMPIVSLDAQELKYQKTIEISLADAKAAQSAGVNQFIQDLPSILPPGLPPGLVGQITGQLSQALPGVVNSIPDSVSFSVQQTLFRPTIAAVMPLYTGGAITATQKMAQGGVSLARSGLNETRDQLQLRLVQAYFGFQLSQSLLQLSIANRDGFKRHLDDARQMEAQGVVSKAQRLQVEVASNAAQRQYDEAATNEEMARIALTNLLHMQGDIRPTTRLFVNSTPLDASDAYVDASQKDFPQVLRTEAQVDIARQGVSASQASYLPNFYLFGERSLSRSGELLFDPDWIVGVGVHYTLFSNTDRRKSESAARERLRAAEAANAQVRSDVKTLTLRAYNEVEAARKAFLSYDTDMEAAQENLRVQDLSFREGEATSAAVVDAQNALNAVLTLRATEAYRYDMALAALLSTSGRMQQYRDYIARADKEVSE